MRIATIHKASFIEIGRKCNPFSFTDYWLQSWNKNWSRSTENSCRQTITFYDVTILFSRWEMKITFNNAKNKKGSWIHHFFQIELLLVSFFSLFVTAIWQLHCYSFVLLTAIRKSLAWVANHVLRSVPLKYADHLSQ